MVNPLVTVAPSLFYLTTPHCHKNCNTNHNQTSPLMAIATKSRDKANKAALSLGELLHSGDIDTETSTQEIMY